MNAILHWNSLKVKHNTNETVSFCSVEKKMYVRMQEMLKPCSKWRNNKHTTNLIKTLVNNCCWYGLFLHLVFFNFCWVDMTEPKTEKKSFGMDTPKMLEKHFFYCCFSLFLLSRQCNSMCSIKIQLCCLCSFFFIFSFLFLFVFILSLVDLWNLFNIWRSHFSSLRTNIHIYTHTHVKKENYFEQIFRRTQWGRIVTKKCFFFSHFET